METGGKLKKEMLLIPHDVEVVSPRVLNKVALDDLSNFLLRKPSIKKWRCAPIRIGIIGAGKNTINRHIPLLQRIPGVTIVAVANRTIKSSQLVCQQFNIPTALDDPYVIINDKNIDAVVIGTWPYMHRPFSIAALQQGKHVMVEASFHRTFVHWKMERKISKQNHDKYNTSISSKMVIAIQTSQPPPKDDKQADSEIPHVPTTTKPHSGSKNYYPWAAFKQAVTLCLHFGQNLDKNFHSCQFL